MNEFHEDMTLTAAEVYDYEPFSYDGYQIVRREMFARIREPAVVIRTDSITFNAACLRGLEDTVYIEILVNARKHSIAVRRCDKDNKDAQRWCVEKPDKRRTRKITSTKFSGMIYDLMNWSDKCRYKIQGERKVLSNDIMYFFDLDSCDIIFENKRKTKKEVLAEPPRVSVPYESRMDESADGSDMPRKPFYPDDWENSFGVPVDKQRSFDIDTLKDSNSFVSVRLDQED